jgi:HK97 family phage prohead protease
MIERRFVTADVEPIALEERSGLQPKIRGLAAVYGMRSRDLGGFVEVIEPGAFDHLIDRRRSSAADDVVALWNHDASQLLGRTSAGTLSLWSDARGLWYEVDPIPNTTLGRDLIEHLRLGNIRGSSFAFTVEEKDQRWDRAEDGAAVRYISKISGLYDVSPVCTPAYGDTTVAVRSFQAWQESQAVPALAPSVPVPIDSTLAHRAAVALARAAVSVVRCKHG